ncbi:MAG: hypothetical protein LUQ31_09560, partial [Methanoregula sp.]|nr:hypothetical protein [Methanoregula sp.]
KARKYRLQVKEIKIKIILYNISRIISTLYSLILIEEFYRAGSQENLIFKILLFPYGDNFNEKDIVKDKKCHPVFPDPHPVTRGNLRAVPDLYYIMPFLGVCGKFF